jgi:apolipoprotein N-acyltransferase
LAKAGLDALGLALAGGAHALSIVYTWAWPLQMLAVGWLVWRVAAGSPRQAAWRGFAFGWAWLAASIWWLFISMHRYGGLPAWMAAAAVALLSAFMAIFLALALLGWRRSRHAASLGDAWLFASWWLLAELVRGSLFTGFPWAASGYAHLDGPLATLAPWLGVYGVGFVAAGLAASAVLGWRASAGSARLKRFAPALVVAAVLVTTSVMGPVSFSRPGGTLSLALLQGNVPQNEKFSIEHLPQTLEWTSQQLMQAQADLVVGPETVIPLLPDQLDPAYWQPLLAHFQQPGRAALIGLPLGNETQGYTNSVAGVSPQTAALPGGHYRYDKHHLVPFGEFIPPTFRWFTEMMNIPLGDFNRGAVAQPSFTVKGERVAPNICFEDLFGEELAARFVDPDAAPTILANISNIGWFGQSIAVVQHLNISRMRALELQRPMVRATNTGATVVIDHRGVVTSALPPYTQGVLQAQVQGRQGITPFAWWAARYGLTLPFGLAAAAIALGWWRGARRRYALS